MEIGMRLFIATVLIFITTAALGGDNAKGIRQCAQYLPEGKAYSYQVDGVIERSPRGTTLKHTVKVSGTKTFVAPSTYKETNEENEKNAAEFAREVAPFQKCLEAVLTGE
jgi:hypothetical protein